MVSRASIVELLCDLILGEEVSVRTKKIRTPVLTDFELKYQANLLAYLEHLRWIADKQDAPVANIHSQIHAVEAYLEYSLLPESLRSHE